MSVSLRAIERDQAQWAQGLELDATWPMYVAHLTDNWFNKQCTQDTRAEFERGDGSELRDSARRPAKMRCLRSSSALAVNFFDAWRHADKTALRRALGLSEEISGFQFEFQTRKYPVGPRSPNLDLLMRLRDGGAVALECKFAEVYSAGDGYGVFSTKYFPTDVALWQAARLPAAQRLADKLKPGWIYLDVPQLLKHMLGLACDPDLPQTLVYLWYDTGRADAVAHRGELERFAAAVANDSVAFRHMTYQAVFGELASLSEPARGWYEYMAARYFRTTAG